MTETTRFQWDVMVDIETLGTAMNAPIIAIAGWPFALDSRPVPFEPFYRNVDAATSVAAGAQVSSFYWWLGQSDAARARLSAPEPVALCEALLDFAEWLALIGGDEREVRLWAHGINFDLPIIQSAWRVELGDNPPWRYNAARDTRTLFHAAGIDWDTEMAALAETEHDALDDCRVQATLVQRAWAVLYL